MQREGGRGPRSTTKTSSSSSLGKRVWALLTMGMYALLTLWRLAIAKANGALLFLDNGLRRRTDFYHKVCIQTDRQQRVMRDAVGPSVGQSAGRSNLAHQPTPAPHRRWCCWATGWPRASGRG